MVIRLRKCLKVYHAKALKIIQAPSARLFHCFLGWFWVLVLFFFSFNVVTLTGEHHSGFSQM